MDHASGRPNPKLKLKLKAPHSLLELGEHALLVRFALCFECCRKADIGTGVVPWHRADELFGYKVPRNLLGCCDPSPVPDPLRPPDVKVERPRRYLCRE